MMEGEEASLEGEVGEEAALEGERGAAVDGCLGLVDPGTVLIAATLGFAGEEGDAITGDPGTLAWAGEVALPEADVGVGESKAPPPTIGEAGGRTVKSRASKSSFFPVVSSCLASSSVFNSDTLSFLASFAVIVVVMMKMKIY